MYTIVKNKPLPPPARGPGSGGGRRGAYPFADMEIGDSFNSGIPSTKYQAAASFKANASQHGVRYGKKFVTRVIDGEIWCWRAE